MAQSVERRLGKAEVTSSNLVSSSKQTPEPDGFGVFRYAILHDNIILRKILRFNLTRLQLQKMAKT